MVDTDRIGALSIHIRVHPIDGLLALAAQQVEKGFWNGTFEDHIALAAVEVFLCLADLNRAQGRGS